MQRVTYRCCLMCALAIKKGAPRGPFLKIALPCALFLGAIVLRVAVHAMSAREGVVVRLARERCLFGALPPDGAALRHAIAPVACALVMLLRHQPHLLCLPFGMMPLHYIAACFIASQASLVTLDPLITRRITIISMIVSFKDTDTAKLAPRYQGEAFHCIRACGKA